MKNEKKYFLTMVFVLIIMCFIPLSVKAENITLKEVTINAIKPTSEEQAFVVFEKIYFEQEYLIDSSTCNANFTECEATYQGKEIKLSINYNYDNDTKKVIDSIVKNITKDNYELTDLEYFNWLTYYLKNLAVDPDAEEVSMVNFSSELKKAVGYKNFSIDIRMGDDFDLLTERGGVSEFTYNDTLYYVGENPLIVSYYHLFYIDSNSNDMVKDVENRLKKEFGNIYTVADSNKTVLEYLNEYFQDLYLNDSFYNGLYSSKEECARDLIQNRVYSTDGAYHHLNNYLNEPVYEVTATIGNLSETYYVIPIKDSSKVTELTYKTIDVNSDIEISTNGKLPLDTLIKVVKLTGGTDYENIIKVLNNENIVMYDLKLFSNALNSNITRLDSGKFEVKIPVPDSLNGKELIVYYVDSNNNIEEHDVQVKDNYAVFTTDHFSIYTLAEKNTIQSNIQNPQTSDNILPVIFTFTISIMLISTLLISKRKKFD